ncbi:MULTISPECIES: CBS domain-containing protein [unclassified Streptomyces]|uniref:CBS domain-containing protein n=1 Tax=Streptomyces TaxID=1883 RepID=UPI0008238ADC|nr:MULTISPECIES: CBS domain-containing protein [unclassified Streptomyces]AWN30551.1 CBS domain-containing protein [Streptomyces sp. NEAU-S7GS2]MYT16757.1 CBS domain-containing protein [Streptomyces sp. SID4951]SCK34941.1 Predicted signal-transduction protein containing cAMP-binding and CBS domains [Streptomyces sp. SceaMP-e96]
MEHRTIGELMTRRVVSVQLDTPFKDIAQILADNAVSAVPVLDSIGRPAGIVSEADLLRKAADRSDLSGRTPLPHLEAWERERSEGRSAGELMSAPAVCAHPEWTVVEAARLMEVQNVKRLPVVDETDALLGIVSRSDLLRVFLRKDKAIKEEISREVIGRTARLGAAGVTADVVQGQVVLHGSVDDPLLIPVLVRMCASVDGVVSVSEDLKPAMASGSVGGSGAAS